MNKFEIKIGNPEMLSIWKNYTTTKQKNKQRAEMIAVKEAKPFLNLCLRQFHVRREYWDDFYSFLLMDFFRALDTYDPSTNVKPFGWVWRLCSQSAWRYIRDKQKSLEKENNTFTINDYEEEVEESNPEEMYMKSEYEDQMCKYVKEYLSCIYRNPIEIELYMRMNGLCGYPQTTKVDKLAEDMQLSKKTIEQLITRNNNDNSKFKKWLRDNNKTENLDFETMHEYKRYAISKRKK